MITKSHVFSDLLQDAGRKANLMLSWDVNNGVRFFSIACFNCVCCTLHTIRSVRISELVKLGQYRNSVCTLSPFHAFIIVSYM